MFRVGTPSLDKEGGTHRNLCQRRKEVQIQRGRREKERKAQAVDSVASRGHESGLLSDYTFKMINKSEGVIGTGARERFGEAGLSEPFPSSPTGYR